jgi:hypothetical protein
MSTFAVFGMTQARAWELARKDWAKKELFAFEPKRAARMIAEAADEIMAGQQIVQLSERYDAPSYCRNFIELAERGPHRGLHIKAFQKTGRTHPTTGAAVREWRVWHE